MSRRTRESTQSLTRAVELARTQSNTRADPLNRSPSNAAGSSKKKSTSSAKKKAATPSSSRKKSRSHEEADEPAPSRRSGAASSSSSSSNKKRRAASPSEERSPSPAPTKRSSSSKKSSAANLSSYVSSFFTPSESPEPQPVVRRKLLLDDALIKIRHEAELGKKQIGFHNDQYIEDISVEFLYKPHTVTALILLVGALIFMAFNLETSTNWLQNLRYGAGAACLFVVILGLLIFPSGPFIRPHPLMWRFAFGIGVIYEIWLIIVLFLSKDQARTSMKLFDENLGNPIAERSYAADCSLTFANVYANVDRFVISHFIGWVVKALILRDPVICWIISLQWELIEILFMHMLPNFAECWWDQWILDVALANGLGIYFGCQLARYLEVKEYNWGPYNSIPSFMGKAKRTIMQFTPASWTRVQWKSTSSITRLVGVQILILAMHIEELNAFFLKYLLWVAPESKLNLVRLLIWAFVGVPSLRQIYSYMSDPTCKRIGHQTFLSVVILATELIVMYKFGIGEFKIPMSEGVKRGAIAFGIGYALILVFLALRIRKGDEKKRNE